MKKQYENLEFIDRNVHKIIEKIQDVVHLKVIRIQHIEVKNFEYNEPYCLYIIGNETHENFDFKFLDKNCKCIIKPYPYIENYSPLNVSCYKKLDDSRFVIRTSPEDPRVLNLPLGPSIKFEKLDLEKNINFGFFGQTSGIRVEALNNMKHITTKTYKGFGMNLDAEDYSRFLSSCKVAFCPTGHSPETYRFYEAAIAGCAIFSTSLPDTEYYNECPAVTLPWQIIVQKNNEEFLRDFCEKILKNYSEIQRMTQLWSDKWNNVNFLTDLTIAHIKKCG